MTKQIKQIKLRGISRTPSDRMTEDGGCLESLNVQLEAGELAPMPAPSTELTKAITGTASGTDFGIMYIHQLPNGGRVYVGRDVEAVSGAAIVRAVYDGNMESLVRVFSLPSGPALTTAARNKKYFLLADDSTAGFNKGDMVKWNYTNRAWERINGYDVTITDNPNLSPLYDFTFSSIGNILILYVKDNEGSGLPDETHYFLFKDGAYTYLGNQIPMPEVEFASYRTGVTAKALSRIVNDSPTIVATEFPLRTFVNMILDGTNGTEEERKANVAWLITMLIGEPKAKEFMDKEHDAVWNAAIVEMDRYRDKGTFLAPFLVRYAVRLYDGNYIYTSVPILCGGGFSKDWISLEIAKDDYPKSNDWSESTTVNEWGWTAKLNNLFKVYYTVRYDAGKWLDFIQGIDIFISTPVYIPSIRSEFISMDDDLNMKFKGSDSDTEEDAMERELLSKAQFFLVNSISIDSLGSSPVQYQLKNSDKVSGDFLLDQKQLPDGYRDESTYVPINGVGLFNNRIAFSGATEYLPRGYMFLNGMATGAPQGTLDISSLTRYAFRFKLYDKNSGEAHYVTSHYYDDGTKLITAYFADLKMRHGDTAVSGADDEFRVAKPYGWISFPDSRCTEVEVYRYDGSSFAVGKRIPMTAHPYLNCSYAFLGLGTSLEDVTNSGNTDYENINNATNVGNDNRTIELPNKLLLSEFQNPYLFPAGGIISFNDEVIGVATTSVPLSEGQLGQFLLYVFTAGGIRTLGVNSLGEIAANSAQPNLAQHIAIKGTILGMEQAVVFTTDRGVMILTGSNVTCISEVMNGRHRNIDDGTESNAVSTLLGGWDGASIMEYTASDETTFMGYVKAATPMFDYNGQRLIFHKENAYYDYVYMMRTATWHKMSCPNDLLVRTVLNSFPECLAQGTTGGLIYNYSTVLDDYQVLSDSVATRYALVGTRPFDLGEPDIRKAITDLRVRGRFNRNDVRYILLGSMDGIHWQILTSLRGGSYKLFRLVLVAELAPTERISWIDVQYETRFTNRLR